MSVAYRPTTAQDWEAVRVLTRFLHGRLQERGTLEWALETTPRELIKRAAVLEVLSTLAGRELPEPWRTAWRLVEERWAEQAREEDAINAYRVRTRVAAGERTGSLVQSIVAHVTPRLDVTMREAPMGKRKPRTAAELVRASVTSPRLQPLENFSLDRIDEPDFLLALARGLEGAVEHGLALARRLGWGEDGRYWQLGDLRAVAYQQQETGHHAQDVDEFHRGIAPSVKLLHAVVRRLSQVSALQAQRVVRGWAEHGGPIHLRLWAAMARDATLVTGAEVAEALEARGDEEFWDVVAFPEVTELRAVRFADLPVEAQVRLEQRVVKGASRRFWAKRARRGGLADMRRYWALRELRRIQVAGGELSVRTEAWLRAGLTAEPDLADMTSVRHGFVGGGVVHHVVPRVDERFDDFVGADRLQALETALSSPERRWDDDPVESATAWIQTGENAARVLSDLESARDLSAYPRILDRLGWALSRPSSEAPKWVPETAQRMLALVLAAPVDPLANAIEGVSYWLSTWVGTLVDKAAVAAAWQKLWPLAVSATNARASDPGEDDLDDAVVAISGDEEPHDLDTLNDPAGRLVGVFLELCPHKPEPVFTPGSELARMRAAITSSAGTAGLIGLHRLVEQLPFFLASDPDWTQEHLIRPLRADDARALVLWRAFARRTHYGRVLAILGADVLERIQDRRLGRERRDILLSSVIVDALYALLDDRAPAVGFDRIQQAVRAVEGEVRARSAQTLQRFLATAAGNEHRGERLTAELVFDRAIAPFLRRAWPPERSLATRGVSAALAGLPASAGDRMPVAVASIEPFLVPFECWSMSDYGFWGENAEGRPQLERIDSATKAAALLKLLDATVGTAADAIIPMDLGDALEQISGQSPSLSASSAFRRLAALARRR